ncbi:MAG TPA: hypothetical protein DCW72_07260 [Elusimicrobia bacterium]|nr:MAG: hypothetical protein A2X29_07655 [Elusimicrobia bacterium GWA2_64_40]OGR62345.1 MAG: hypothetical protein A2X30_03670 [Elusimicrobia bacterium GWB2_63_16]HAN04949.1 hypothetical protein [Elusimicrobiota bacterium]HAU90011.1 hypothetical protein [Elusimicrobiota bacterium]
MAKKTARKHRAEPPVKPQEAGAAAFSADGEGERRGKSRWLWISAFFLIISGYALLHKADPGGRNTWAIVSPACLLAGYLLIIPAILVTYRDSR